MTFEKLTFEVKGVQITGEKAVRLDEMELVFDKADDLINVINEAFETGYWTGSHYELLHSLKADLYSVKKSIEDKVMKSWKTA